MCCCNTVEPQTLRVVWQYNTVTDRMVANNGGGGGKACKASWCVEAFSSPLLVSFAIGECKHDSYQLVICTSRWPTSDSFHTFIVVSVNGLRQDCTCCVGDNVAALYLKTRELCWKVWLLNVICAHTAEQLFLLHSNCLCLVVSYLH